MVESSELELYKTKVLAFCKSYPKDTFDVKDENNFIEVRMTDNTVAALKKRVLEGLKLDDSKYPVVFYTEDSSGARLDAEVKVSDSETLYPVGTQTAQKIGDEVQGM